jgi:LPXTG-motif cell wall-anchored protein
MPRLFLSSLAIAATMAVMTPAPASAATYDTLAYVTFSGPVQIPGVTLNAGMYRFRLANPETSRNVLQVLSHDGAIVYAMFHTVPDSRMALTEEPVVTFRETPAGVPPAVKSLFYGGEYRGYEFVYPRGGPIMFAGIVPQPEITYSPFPAAAAPAPEPIAIPEPQPVPEPVVEAEPLALAEAVSPPEAVKLPRTATPMPLVALGGLTSLLVGLGVGFVRRRAN